MLESEIVILNVLINENLQTYFVIKQFFFIFVKIWSNVPGYPNCFIFLNEIFVTYNSIQLAPQSLDQKQ